MRPANARISPVHTIVNMARARDHDRVAPWTGRTGRKESGPVNVQASLWRSIAVFRVASLVYAAVLIVVDRADYRHLGWAWAVLAGMAAWTAFTSAAYAVPARRTRLLLAADLLVTAAALASTALLQYPGSVAKAASR